MLIKNYGLFWKADHVFWGKPNVSGTLMGIPAKSRTFGNVDFREQTGIYVLYRDFRIIYIGQAGHGDSTRKLFQRLKDHRSDHLAGRWDSFSWFGLRKVTMRGELGAEASAHHMSKQTALNQIEAILIHSSEPPLNRQGGKWGRDVEQYLQFVDPNILGAPIDRMIQEIHKKLIK